MNPGGKKDKSLALEERHYYIIQNTNDTAIFLNTYLPFGPPLIFMPAILSYLA
jgi:hypothetical protein